MLKLDRGFDIIAPADRPEFYRVFASLASQWYRACYLTIHTNGFLILYDGNGRIIAEQAAGGSSSLHHIDAMRRLVVKGRCDRRNQRHLGEPLAEYDWLDRAGRRFP